MGGINRNTGAPTQPDKRPDDKRAGNMFAKGVMAVGAGIAFSKGKPTFKKSEHVGNKGDFPELGMEQKGSDKKP
jgi:hypothetical protein